MEITPTSLIHCHPDVKLHVLFFIKAVLYSVRLDEEEYFRL